MEATLTPSIEIFTANPKNKTNEEAFIYWETILKEFAILNNFNNKTHTLSVTFNYKTYKNKSRVWKMLSKPEVKQFTTFVRCIVVFRKDMKTNYPNEAPCLWLRVNDVDERKFLQELPVDEKGFPIFGQMAFVNTVKSNIISIPFLDLVSIKIIED